MSGKSFTFSSKFPLEMVFVDQNPQYGVSMVTYLYRGAQDPRGHWIGKSRCGGSRSSSAIKIRPPRETTSFDFYSYIAAILNPK